jgi:ABC-type Mn2+/Zn2+ transport system permease subunit
MGYVKNATRIREDAVIGIVFTTFFAAGLLIVSINPVSVNLKSIIQGNMIGITTADLRQMLIISAVAMLAIALKWRDLVLFAFDPVQARAVGLSVGLLHTMLLALLAATAIAALQTVGACLVVAMLVTPGATAYLLTDRFGRMMILAMIIGGSTAAVGAYSSYFINASVGGCIVVLQTLIFLGALVLAPRHGMLAARRRAADATGLTSDLAAHAEGGRAP